jgi:hypothetical protein
VSKVDPPNIILKEGSTSRVKISVLPQTIVLDASAPINLGNLY